MPLASSLTQEEPEHLYLGTITALTVIVAPFKTQFVAPVEVYVQPEPLMVAVPALFPVIVEPETEAIAELLDWKLPPVKPLGAEAVEVWPTLIEEDERDTVPEGQEPGVTV